MAWIELHQSVYSHRKTLRLARLLSLDRWSVVGRISAFWNWALDSAQDGTVPAEDIDFIADVMGWEGDPEELVQAMISAGFLEKQETIFVIHDWWDYGGKLIEARRVDAERKRNERAAKRVQRTSEGHPQDIQPTSDRRVQYSTAEKNALQATSLSELLPIDAGKQGRAAASSENSYAGTPEKGVALAHLPATLIQKFSEAQLEKELEKWKKWVSTHPRSKLTMEQFISWMDKVRPEEVIPPHETDVQRFTRILKQKPNEKGIIYDHEDGQTYTVWKERLRTAKRVEEAHAYEERCRQYAALEALYAGDETGVVPPESSNHKTPD